MSAEEVKIQKLREEELTQLRIVLGRRTPINRRADLYLRVAELYLEAYRVTFLLEGRVHEKRLESKVEDTLIDRTHSKPYVYKGIQSCLDILKLKIPFQHIDRVYYFLGFYYTELDQNKESRKYFEWLVEKYPSSVYVTEAYRELGEIAYKTNQFRKSLHYLELAIQKPADLGSHYPRVLHRLAWNYYRTKQYEKAVLTLKNAISQSVDGGEKFLSLKEEALRDMALFMTETGKAEEALSYFEKVAGDKGFYTKSLEKLGKQYERALDLGKANQVYEVLLQTAGDEGVIFRVLVKIVDLDLRRGKPLEALERIKKNKILYRGDSETEISAQNLKAMVRRTATENHENFRKKSDRSALQICEAYYSTYLDLFLNQDSAKKEIPEIQMYLAEVKRDLGKSKEALALYKKVIDSGDPRYLKEAAVLRLTILNDALKKEAAKTVTEPSKIEKEFIEESDALKVYLEDMPEAREGALKSAQILAGYPSSQKEAIKRVQKILEKWPKTIQAVVAARLWIQLSEGARELKDILKTIQDTPGILEADKAQGGGKLKQVLSEQESKMQISQIALFEKEKNYAEAGKAYEAFAAVAHKLEVSEKALSNAFFAYLKVQDLDSVLRVAKSWMSRFPKSKAYSVPIRGAATSFFILGKFADSAFLFEHLHEQETADKIYEGLGLKKTSTRKNKKTAYWTSMDQFRMAEKKEGEAHFTALELPEKKLKQGLTQRLKFFESLSKAYKKVIALGGPWAIAALDRLANFTFSLSEEIEKITPPQSLTPDGSAKFKANLKSISEPLRKKAMDTWKEAYNSAQKNEILSPALASIADRLSLGRRGEGVRVEFQLAGNLNQDEKVTEKLFNNPLNASLWVDYGNRLWSLGQPRLALIAYDRALSIAPKGMSALNNKAVLMLELGGEDLIQTAYESLALFKETQLNSQLSSQLSSQSSSNDKNAVIPKINLLLLFRYYHLEANTLWGQVLSQVSSSCQNWIKKFEGKPLLGFEKVFSGYEMGKCQK